MTYQKPDGTIEIGLSGCSCHPPGKKTPGMHANGTSEWWRINDDEWKRTPPDHMLFKYFARESASIEEFLYFADELSEEA